MPRAEPLSAAIKQLMNSFAVKQSSSRNLQTPQELFRDLLKDNFRKRQIFNKSMSLKSLIEF